MQGKCYSCGEARHLARNCPRQASRGFSLLAPSSVSQRSVPQPPKAKREQREGRVFVLVPGEAISSETVVGIFIVSDRPVFTLMDSGSTHSFVSTSFASNMNVTLEPLCNTLSRD